MRIPLEKGEKIQLSELFDWYKVHKDDLTFAQREFYESVKKRMRERITITKRQIEVLKRIKSHHEPDKELIIRQNF